MTMEQYIEEAESALLHTYNRYQIVLDKGDGNGSGIFYEQRC